MNMIFIISAVSILISLAVAYLSIINAESEEAKIINEIQIQYPTSTRYFA